MSSPSKSSLPSSVSNEELALRAQEGCLASFDELVRRLSPALLQFLAQRAPSFADAEDLCQEAFLRAFENLQKYRPKWRFTTWLFTIARRSQLNESRKRQLRASTESIDRVSSGQPEPVDAMVAIESRQHIWELARQSLSQPQCDALWLFYVEEMSIQEVARVLGRTRVGVRTLLYRARKRLHTELGDAEDWGSVLEPHRELPVGTLGTPARGYSHA